MNREIPSARALATLAVAALLLRAPFLGTGHVQEDAYIAFRIGFNLADHGELTFNLGEHYAASTSLLQVYLIALVRWCTGALAIRFILLANAVVAALAVVQLVRVFQLSATRSWAFVVAMSLSTGALLPSFSGMETCWCLLYVALLAEHAGPTPIRPWQYAALLGVASFLRPDAILLSLAAWVIRALGSSRVERRHLLVGGVGLVLGLGVYLGVNWHDSSRLLPASIIAKSAAYHPDHSLAAVLQRSFAVYLEGPLSLLPSSRYLPPLVVVAASVAMLGALAVSLARVRRCLPAPDAARFLFLASVAVLFPACFASAGVMFPWYFQPASFALAACLLVAIDRQMLGVPRRLLSPLAVGFFAGSAVLQLLISVNVGRQESGYRASVGKYLAQQAAPGDTLVLEPAGYIPYFSGLTTYDEIGLASPRVLPYLKDGSSVAEFLRDVCPTFTVQRGVFPATGQAGVAPAQVAAEAWFVAHYRILRRFVYRPEEWASGALERAILRLGSHADYVVYQLNDPTSCSSR